ncbi:MAG TPA: hypothetical protein VI702_04880, partial [Nitrospiria bacterium]
DCHKGVSAPHDFPLRPMAEGEDCANCHRTAVEKYRSSIHGQSRQNGAADAAGCSSCHGPSHTIKPARDPASPTYPLNLPRTCAQCHANPKIAEKYGLSEENIYQLYMDSIHGRAVTKGGLLVAANCTSCHGAHEIRSSRDAASPTHRANVPETCGSCHAGILKAWRSGIHGERFAAGLSSAPVCSDCHASHQIRPVDSEAWKLDTVKECGNCHVESQRTFRDTFHGQVTRLGFTRVARCADCHGAHDIRPARDPASAVHSSNLMDTCKKCHPKATAGFVQYDPHADTHDRKRNPVLYFTAVFMTLLLLGVFSFFGLHTLLWAVRSGVARARGESPGHGSGAQAAHYIRFTVGQRWLHGILIAGFLGIVITGMPLMYSGADWAARLANALGGFGVMGVFHRLFAIVLTGLFLYHLGQIAYWVLVQHRWGVVWGPNSLMPQPRDIVEMGRNFMWFFGLGPRPKFGRFTYWEKFDYLAVFWGMPVIGITGYILWFDEFFARFIPGWLFNVALLIHGEEALLATAFIFTIHYFNTHLRPEKFPMDLVIFTGRVSEGELREERPEEFALRTRDGTLDSIRTGPPERWLENVGRVVGVIAVTIGLILFVLILIAVFGE